MNPQSYPSTAIIKLGSITADNTQIPAMHFVGKARVTKAVLINGATVAASDTDYVQVALQVADGGKVIAELDSRAAHEDGLTAMEAKEMNLADGEGTLLEAGTTLEVDYQEAGTVELTDAILVLHYYYV